MDWRPRRIAVCQLGDESGWLEERSISLTGLWTPRRRTRGLGVGKSRLVDLTGRNQEPFRWRSLWGHSRTLESLSLHQSTLLTFVIIIL